MSLALGAGLLIGAAPSLHAQATAVDVDAVAEELNFRGYYLDPGRPEDFEGLEALELGSGTGRYVAMFDGDVTDAADILADDLRNIIEEDATVLVIVGTEEGSRDVGASSDVYGDTDLDPAFDAAEVAAGGDGTAITAAFFGALDGNAAAPLDNTETATDEATTSSAPADADASDSGGGGIGFFPILLLLIALGVGGWLLLKRRAKHHDTAELDRAKTELKAQLGSIATTIVENEDRVNVSGNEEAIRYFREANTTYTAVGELLPDTKTLLELAALDDRLDRARWQLDAADALLEGRAVPAEPTPDAPAACFFDPTHRPATEEATIRTSAGSKDVFVCKDCAARLAKGELPEPRMIDVGGRRVPAAAAPRSHGGLGMGGLSIFAIILKVLGGLGGGGLGGGGGGGGGMGLPGRVGGGGGLDIDWSGHLPERRSGRQSGPGAGGPFGPDRLPSRPRGLPRTQISKGPAMGRGRRRM